MRLGRLCLVRRLGSAVGNSQAHQLSEQGQYEEISSFVQSEHHKGDPTTPDDGRKLDL